MSLKIRDRSSLPSPDVTTDSVNAKALLLYWSVQGYWSIKILFLSFRHTTCVFTVSIVDWTFIDIYYIISQHDNKTTSFINIPVFLLSCNIYPWWQEQINDPLVFTQWNNFKQCVYLKWIYQGIVLTGASVFIIFKSVIVHTGTKMIQVQCCYNNDHTLHC